MGFPAPVSLILFVSSVIDTGLSYISERPLLTLTDAFYLFHYIVNPGIISH